MGVAFACNHCYCHFLLVVTQCVCLNLISDSMPSSVFMLEVHTLQVLNY